MVVSIPSNAAAMQALVAHDNVAAAALTISQRYNDENAFLCLLNTLGCGYQERFRILHNGFTSMHDLIQHYGDDIDGFSKQLKSDNKNWSSHPTVMMRAFFPPVVIGRLVGVLHYVNSGVNMFHKIPNILNITPSRATAFNIHYNDSQNREESDEADNVIVPPFTEVKGWRSFKENFLLVLGLTKGARGIPLDYVVDTIERTATNGNAPRVEQENIDLEEPDLYKENVVHFGNAFKLDNKAVWNKIHTLLLDTPAYNHISSFATRKNGRGAWLALIAFYEGEDFCQRLRETAFSKLQTTFYRGETNRFTFEKYINIHKEAHKMLQDAGFNNGTGLDEESMTTYFRNGIKPDAGLEVSISNSRSNPRLNTFDALLSFFTAEVQHNAMRRNQLRMSRDRKVSAVNRDSNNGRSNGAKKGGKSKKKGHSTSEIVDGKRVEGRWYSKEEFGKLTSAQRSAVIKLKRKANSSQSESNNRSVSALREELRDDLVSLGDAIISGVAHAQVDNNAGEQNAINERPSPDSSAHTRQSAESGSIGNIFRNRKKQRSGR